VATTPVDVRGDAERLTDRVRTHRRALHRRPELAWAEHHTAAYIEGHLSALGVEHRRVLGTGVVAVVPGRGPRTVGIRADMDALPVTEAPGRDGYRSTVEGASHACGHDAHVAIALGVAELFASTPDLPGTVTFYFQPAEETTGGAAPMVAAGVLDDPQPDAVLALHVASRLASGVVGLRDDLVTAAHDSVRIVIHGVGGHGAHPEDAVDPVPIAAQIVTAAQTIITREIGAFDPAIITFGSVHGGTAANVIASEVRLEATIRTLNPATRQLVVGRLGELTEAIARAHRATAEVVVHHGYGVGRNDPHLAGLVATAGVAVLGDVGLIKEPYPSLGAEDFFAFGSTGTPVCMFQLGVANPDKGIDAPHHSPWFDLDEDALPVGVAVMAESARRVLLAGT
jgi:amidohydrolase